MVIDEEKAINELIKLYNDAFYKIQNRIIAAVKLGEFTGRDQTILNDINKELNTLLSQTVNFSSQAIPDMYNQRRLKVIDWFNENLTDPMLDPAFSKIHTEAIRLMQNNLTQGLYENTIQNIGRNVSDYFREAQLENSKILSTGSLTRKQTSTNMINMLQEKNIFEFVDKAGRKWNMQNYVDMAIRTTADAGINRATINQNIEYNNDLIMMTWHSTSCPLCAVYQGRIYSISGESKIYPALSKINGGSFITFGVVHPNCRHTITPYVPALDLNKESNVEYSSSPFDDNRSEYGKERYNNRQKTQVLKKSIADMEQENTFLKLKPIKTDEEKQRIVFLESSMRKKLKKLENIKKWEMDSLPVNNLFVKIPKYIKDNL